MHYEMSVAARKALAKQYDNQYGIAYENVMFTPPNFGDAWLKFDYAEADTIYLSIDRKCISYIGMVQISVVFQPNSGVDRARALAKDIANFFEDGKILDTCYISEGARVHPMQKSETGWLIPIRFYVRTEEKRS